MPVRMMVGAEARERERERGKAAVFLLVEKAAARAITAARAGKV